MLGWLSDPNGFRGNKMIDINLDFEKNQITIMGRFIEKSLKSTEECLSEYVLEFAKVIEEIRDIFK